MNIALKIEKTIMNWLKRDYRRRAFGQALPCTYALFARKYPQWSSVTWFNEETKQRRITELLPVANDFMELLQTELQRQEGLSAVKL